jgi:hypothetical protein
MYTVYRTFREGTGQNVTLQCESPVELRGKSWDVLEEMCKPTVTPPQLTVTGSTANTTAFSTSQPDQSNTAVQRDVSVQESSPDASHSPSPFVVMFVGCFAAAVLIAVVVIMIIIRRLQSPTLNRLWWEDVVSRQEFMSK